MQTHTLRYSSAIVAYRAYARHIISRTAPKEVQSNLASLGLYDGRIDGLYGPRTESALINAAGTAWRILTGLAGHRYDPVAEHPGLSRLRRGAVSGTLFHWPGGNEDSAALSRLWAKNASRGKAVSSHAGVDEHGVVWYAAPHFVTYHAGAANGQWIGVDICAPILADTGRTPAEKRGIFAGEVPYKGKACLALDPRIAAHTATAQRLVMDVTGGDAWADHATVDPGRKWDVIPWRPALHDAIKKR